MIDLDYSFIRLRDNFNDAKTVEECPTTSIFYHDQIRLAKGEAYTQISNSPTSITFNGNYEVFLIDSCGNEVIDVTSNIFLEEFLDTNGVRQVKWEFLQNYEYYTQELSLRFRNTVNDDTWYTNLFMCTDYEKEKTTRLDYWHKDILDGTNFDRAQVKCSIRLALYYQNAINESERPEYHQISTGNTVAQRNIKKFKSRYILDFTSEWIDLRLESIITASSFYINCIRAYSTTPIEFEERELDSNVRENELILNRNLTDTYTPSYQIFEGLTLVFKSPTDSICLPDLTNALRAQFNLPITIGTGTLTVHNSNDGSILQTYTQADLVLDDAYTFSIPSFASTITSNGSWYVNFSAGLITSADLSYPGINDNTSWTFAIQDGEFDENEFDNDFLVGCPASAVDSSLVLAYNFNETSGTTVNDSSASGLNGANVNAQINQTGVINQSYLFNDNGATNQYVDIPDSDILSFTDGTNDTTFSITMWIRPENTFGAILNKYNATDGYEYRLYMQSGILLFFIYSENTTTNNIGIGDNTNINTNQWNHIAITWDGANMVMKVNNNTASFAQAQNGTYVKMNNTSSIVRIAQESDNDTGGNRFEGGIDALKIYKNKVLTASEITLDYNSGNGTEI